MDRPEEDRLELKYCERCGTLWLRPAGSPNLCARCTARAAAGPRQTSARKPYRQNRRKS